MLNYMKYGIIIIGSFFMACGTSNDNNSNSQKTSLKESLQTLRSRLTTIKKPETLNSNFDRRTVLKYLKIQLKIRQTLRKYIEEIPEKMKSTDADIQNVYGKLDRNASMSSQKESLYGQKLESIEKQKNSIKQEYGFLNDEIIKTNHECFKYIFSTFEIIGNTDKNIDDNFSDAEAKAFVADYKAFNDLHQRIHQRYYEGYGHVDFATKKHRDEDKYQGLFKNLLEMTQKVIDAMKTSEVFKNNKEKYADITQALENIRIELDEELSLEFFKDFK